MDRTGLPVARPGQCIGLLGGSFDPAHEGHAHITREALKRLCLDRVWWLVSPGNPLKAEGPAPLPRRMAAARDVMQHPRVVVTDVEARMGTRFTAETLEGLMRLYPGVRFVWLMGADNLATFDRWQRWRWIMENVPVAVIARPGQMLSAHRPKAAAVYAQWALRGREARRLCESKPPAWCFLNVTGVDISSTQIRARGGWRR